MKLAFLNAEKSQNVCLPTVWMTEATRYSTFPIDLSRGHWRAVLQSPLAAKIAPSRSMPNFNSAQGIDLLGGSAPDRIGLRRGCRLFASLGSLGRCTQRSADFFR